ncbi:MAG: aminodeoxychorismate lyase [bacterium]
MTANHPLTWVNGTKTEVLPTSSRGLAYGHGLFETIRIFRGQPVLMDLHIRRLQMGVTRLRLGARDTEDLVTALMKNSLPTVYSELSEASQGVLKMLVLAGGKQRGYAPDRGAQPHCVVQFFPDDGIRINACILGVSLFPCEYRLPLNPVLAGIKHLNRLDQVLAASEFDPESFEDGLVCDVDGYPIETVSRNLFARIGGEWRTPSLEKCGVDGVMRRYLLDDVLPSMDDAAAVGPVSMSELLSAEELFVCNSVSGIWPVVTLHGRREWPIGENTRRLMRSLGEVQPCFNIDSL